MGVEDAWQDRLPPRRARLWRGRDDRNGSARRRSILLLIVGAALAVLAVLVARFVPGSRSGSARPAVATTPAVVAAADIGFGERLTPEKVKLIDVPAKGLPAGHFTTTDPLITAAGRTAMRPIAANEIITETALVAGATRLSAAPLLGPTMRALAVQVSEVAGVSGLVFPGDRVDVLLTRQPEEALPHAELLAQNLRVLAVGSDMNIAREKPGVVRSVTVEVQPLQAQKLTLAMATGSISLALRPFSNGDRVRLQSLQVSDLNDGTTTRLVRKPGTGPGAAAPTAPAGAARRPAASVTVMRGRAATPAEVLP